MDTSLVPSTDPGVLAGYKAIYNATAENLMTPLGHVEFLMYATGSKGASPQTLSIQVALQHPFSHGRLYISTDDPFDSPTIDPQYFSHPSGKSIHCDILPLLTVLQISRCSAKA